MEIVFKKKTIILTPENGKDCFDLGYLSEKIDNTMTFSGTPHFAVGEMRISTKELLKFLLNRKN